MANTRVLLVDDEEEFVAFLERRLKKRGFETWTAANGLDGLKLLGEHRIDVVILDVKMSGLGGMETLRNIKHRHSLVEVIMLTGHGSAESAVEGLKLGAFDFVTKPCDISVLMTKIREARAKKKPWKRRSARRKPTRSSGIPWRYLTEKKNNPPQEAGFMHAQVKDKGLKSDRLLVYSSSLSLTGHFSSLYPTREFA